jgi:hypothetical protein
LDCIVLLDNYVNPDYPMGGLWCKYDKAGAMAFAVVITHGETHSKQTQLFGVHCI